MLSIERLLNFYNCKSDNNTVAVVQIKDSAYTVYKKANLFYIAENELTRIDYVSTPSEQINQHRPNRTIVTINQHTVECRIENRTVAEVHLASAQTDVFINEQSDSFEIIDAGDY